MNKIGALFTTFVISLTAAASFGTFATIPLNEYFQNMSGLKAVGLVVYYLFPRMTFLDKVSSGLLFNQPTDLIIWEQVTHLVIITSIYVFLANYFVKRKNF